MYVVLIIALVLVIAISAVWSPIFALVIALPLFALFLAYVGFSRRADEKITLRPGLPRARSTTTAESGARKRPEAGAAGPF